MASFQQPAVAVSTKEEQAVVEERSLAVDSIYSLLYSIQPTEIGNGNGKHMGVEAGACQSFIGL